MTQMKGDADNNTYLFDDTIAIRIILPFKCISKIEQLIWLNKQVNTNQIIKTRGANF